MNGFLGYIFTLKNCHLISELSVVMQITELGMVNVLSNLRTIYLIVEAEGFW